MLLTMQNIKIKKRIWVFVVYFIFLIAGIPWYWPDESSLILFGLPAWVFIAILVSLLTSIFTAFLLLKYPWETEIELDE